MVVLTDKDIKTMVAMEQVVGEDQMQPAGVDLTVKSIEIFDEPGSIDFSNDKRLIPRGTILRFDSHSHPDSMSLAPGVYRVQVNPILHIPKDCIAFALPRSSLTRMGCSIQGGFWDPGYEGDAVFSLLVQNRLGVRIYRNARIAQIVFIKTTGNSDTLYEGQYQGHGIEE